ncbi:MAG: hypothetical protein K2W82_19160 [Candidatus Obscuribacterales bacterium]|nr:hypothetical protein [Candidatus Obscuribacterales bacterium]
MAFTKNAKNQVQKSDAVALLNRFILVSDKKQHLPSVKITIDGNIKKTAIYPEGELPTEIDYNGDIYYLEYDEHGRPTKLDAKTHQWHTDIRYNDKSRTIELQQYAQVRNGTRALISQATRRFDATGKPINEEIIQTDATIFNEFNPSGEIIRRVIAGRDGIVSEITNFNQGKNTVEQALERNENFQVTVQSFTIFNANGSIKSGYVEDLGVDSGHKITTEMNVRGRGTAMTTTIYNLEGKPERIIESTFSKNDPFISGLSISDANGEAIYKDQKERPLQSISKIVRDKNDLEEILSITFKDSDGNEHLLKGSNSENTKLFMLLRVEMANVPHPFEFRSRMRDGSPIEGMLSFGAVWPTPAT